MKYLSLGLGALLFVGLVAPFISAARYGQQIKQALESALGRKVEIGKVHYTLFSGPGFSIEDVSIAEDPRYGLEPCAYVSNLEVRVRIDKLLLGKIQVAGLQLVDPSLNFVKRADGTWNVVELLGRLSALQGDSWSLFPALKVSGARLDFKLGTRKTVFYVADADLSLYAERSGQLHLVFAGSPARTDRNGQGFGHFRGAANWYSNPSDPQSPQLDADLYLEQSNLSELTTLIEGYDIGVHGEVSSHAHLVGPATALKFRGSLQLSDVHRWDLLPASGEDWSVRYSGAIDLIQHRFELQTLPPSPDNPSPVALRVRVNDFLTAPSWAVIAQLHAAPAQNVLPLAKRMGLAIPDGLNLTGTLDGAVGYSNRSGWNGGVALANVVAVLPGLPPLKAPLVNTGITGDRIRVYPTDVETTWEGKLRVGADYFPSSRNVNALMTADAVPVDSLNKLISAWFGPAPALRVFTTGQLSGQMRYIHEASVDPQWSGQFQLAKGSLAIPDLAAPVSQLSGRFAFNNRELDATHLNAMLGNRQITGEYHYNASAVRPERVRLELPVADLAECEQALEPVLRSQGFLARLRFGRRTLPAWLQNRNLEGDVEVNRLVINGEPIGRLRSHLVWQGAAIDLSSLQLQLRAGNVRGRATVSLAGNLPRYRLTGELAGYPWKDGFMNASGRLDTSGTGKDTLLNLRASGTFDGRDLNITSETAFERLSGHYDLGFEGGWPQLRLTQLEVDQDAETWQGTAASARDGSLVFDLNNGARQLRIVSTLDSPPSNGIAPFPRGSTARASTK